MNLGIHVERVNRLVTIERLAIKESQYLPVDDRLVKI